VKIQGIGEYDTIDVTPTTTSITFKDRLTAEKFMYGIRDGEIPGAGKVEMTWVSTPLPPVNLSVKKEDEEMQSMEMDASPQHGAGAGASVTSGQREMENLDYEVADDEDYIG
jgi:RNA-binding protein 26